MATVGAALSYHVGRRIDAIGSLPFQEPVKVRRKQALELSFFGLGLLVEMICLYSSVALVWAIHHVYCILLDRAC